MCKQIEFINKIKDAAIEVQSQYNIFASVTIAQAILESGWGESNLAKSYNNLFGIKALRDWTGETANVDTKEYTNNEIVTVKQPFRIYKNWAESILDHALFLKKEWYTKAGVFTATNCKEQIQGIFNGGYTTDFNYIDKILDLIEKYNLEKYDMGEINMNIIDTNLKFRNGLPNNNSPRNIVLHHTECNGWSIERLHELHKGNGWSGIGYHFYIRKNGSIYRGRPEWTIGSHCKGFNKNSIGIAFEGDYHNTDKAMPDTQFNAGLQLIAYLKNKYGNMNIYGHREVGSSNCPGKYFPLNNFKNSKSTTTNTSSGSLDGRMAICTGNGVRIRSSMDTTTTNNILGILNKNDTVKVFKKHDNWYEIYYGQHGAYVSADYISLI
ncbi:SH3 domain-containing protein [Clostridium botulinum C]|uniref:glucosaminidase domain-containing protein n=1 Tax=Clostridium botulinum TaxID=1491 RepID=UPI001E5C0F24|nr:glucosaminidase domain-containing protein [Clostridium botulinum]MCD3217819.1 SH3 domain-containing protein [Clostridium botulinum C]